MTIAIDLRPLETGNRYRGFGYYIYHLYLELLKIDKKNHYLALICSKNNLLYKTIAEQENSRPIFLPYPKWRPRLNWLYDHFALPVKLRKQKFDLYISLDFNLPLLLKWLKPKIKTISTIHDLIPFLLWHEYGFAPDRKLLYKIQLYAAKKGDKIITISYASAKDIAAYLKIGSDRVITTYLAADQNYQPIAKTESDKILRKYSVNFPYLLSVGEYLGDDPRKNYDLLLDMLKILKEKKVGDKLKILYVGRKGGKHNEYEKIIQKMKKYEMQSETVFTGFVPEEDMPALFSRAEAFVYPTRYEGFGLPILQAQACGCPVIASNNSSIPEVGGKAALLCRTGDAEDFVRAYKKILENREYYVKLGFENIRRFSWRKTAEETLKIIENL